jgi:hypothetical protein
MKNHVSDAELMRQLLNSIANPKATRLYESVALQEEQVILETERQVQEKLIPAFHAVFESYKGRVQEADAQGYTDEELLALAKKYPNIQDLIAAHANLRDEPATQDLDKDSALRTLKGAAATILKKTQSSDPLVPRPVEWVANREDKLQQSLSKADPKGKYKKLSAIFQKLSKVVKKHPKTANAVVGLMGVSIPILASGYWWAAPAALILTKTVTDMLNGASFKSAVAKNITFTAIGAAIGGAIRYSDAISNTLDSWLSGQSEPIGTGIPSGEAGDYASDKTGTGIPSGEAGDYASDKTGTGIPSGEAGDYAPSNRGGRSFPGEVGYDQPDNRRSFPGEVGIDAASGTGFDIDWREHPTGLYTAVGGERIRDLDYSSFYNSFEDFLADNPSLRSREYAEPGEIIRMRPDNNDAGQIDSQTSGEADDYGRTTNIQTREYTVQRGDNLSTLAQKNNLSVRELLAANPQITNPDQLRTGETINIPSETGSRTYDQGVGSRSDTQAGLRSGRFTNRQGF